MKCETVLVAFWNNCENENESGISTSGAGNYNESSRKKNEKKMQKMEITVKLCI